MTTSLTIFLAVSVAAAVGLAASAAVRRRSSALAQSLSLLALVGCLLLPLALLVPVAGFTIDQGALASSPTLASTGSVASGETARSPAKAGAGRSNSPGAKQQSPPFVASSAVLAFIWLGGVVVLTIRFAGGLLKSRNIVRSSRLWRGPKAAALTPQGMQVRVAPGVVPFLWPGRTPVIVMDDADEDLERQALVIRHEALHHHRGDVWAIWIAALTQMIWWPNPVVWGLARWHRILVEEACDEGLIQQGVDPQQYAELLVACLSPAAPPVPAMGATFRQMRRRVLRLQSTPRRPVGTLGRWVCGGALGLTLATVGAATVYQRSNALAGEITFLGEVLSPHRDGDYPRQRLQVVALLDGKPQPETAVDLEFRNAAGHQGWLKLGPLTKFDQQVHTFEFHLPAGVRPSGQIRIHGVVADGVVDGLALGMTWRDEAGLYQVLRTANPTPTELPTTVCAWPLNNFSDPVLMQLTRQDSLWGVEAARRAICGAELLKDGTYQL